MNINLIVACQPNQGIGQAGKIPWYLPEDLDYFSKVTKGHYPNDPSLPKNVVVMGRKTWESIPLAHRPLKDRINIILSKNPSSVTDNYPIENQDLLVLSHLDDIFNYFRKQHFSHKLGDIYVIGGKSIYQYFLENIALNRIYLTEVFTNHECDVTFPQINSPENYYHLTSCSEVLTSRQGPQYQFKVYQRYPEGQQLNGMAYQGSPFPNIGEYGYLNLINQVLANGNARDDRTGVGTRSLFGVQMRYNLEDSFPLLTTKKMFIRGIIEELLWFLRGETDAKILQEKRVKIWDGNSSREYLDSIGLTDNREGDCGPIYGHNFRHYGAKYLNCETDYSGQGYDQVQECLRLIKENPTSRRIMINLWNPGDLDKVALPPCHVLYQFYVDGDYLSCSLYQRSGDIGLGVPFNIASASIMTHIFARLTGKRPKELVHTIGDAHIYENHLEAMKTQLTRNPYPFPILKVKDRGQNRVEDFSYDDFSLLGYQHHPALKMEMAV